MTTEFSWLAKANPNLTASEREDYNHWSLSLYLKADVLMDLINSQNIPGRPPKADDLKNIQLKMAELKANIDKLPILVK